MGQNRMETSVSKVVLVTGGAGYIGSHTSKLLRAAGYMPVVYDNMVNGNEWAVKWGPFEKGDIGDCRRVKEVLEQYNPVAIMHFAAFAYVGESVFDPMKYYDNNIRAGISLLETALDCGVENIVFSSSCATFGVPETDYITENHTQIPINPYGATKLMFERILSDVSNSRTMNYRVLRYFNAAGADPDGEIGEHHSPETHIIPRAIMAALELIDEITILGADYDTPDGTCVRDFVHVCDLAKAHVLALDQLLKNGGADDYNLGNGKGYSVKKVIQTVEKVTGKTIKVSIGDRRLGDPAVLVSSAEKARIELGWVADFPDIYDIIKTAFDWEKRKIEKRISYNR